MRLTLGAPNTLSESLELLISSHSLTDKMIFSSNNIFVYDLGRFGVSLKNKYVNVFFDLFGRGLVSSFRCYAFRSHWFRL